MADLTITSETGMFHSACRCTWDVVKWYGFHPAWHRAPVSVGEVDYSNRDAFINHSISFEVNDMILQRAIAKVEARYQGSPYVLGHRDCVSFSAEVARECYLQVPTVNMTPYGLVCALAVWNPHKSMT